jgi:hypothetical protein
VVNAEAGESDLTALAADSIAERLGGATVVTDAARVPARAFAAGGSRALDRTMLWLALALLVVESVHARRTSARAVVVNSCWRFHSSSNGSARWARSRG